MIKTLSYLAVAGGAFALGRVSANKRQVLKHSADAFQTVQGRALEPHHSEKRPMTGERFLMLLFLIGWLIAWTVGCLAALAAVLRGQGGLFLIGWLVAAAAGWVLAANTIYRLVSGKPVQTRGNRDI